MFIKLLTIITALFVGGAKAPPSIHKQRQPNTIKETYVQRGNNDWQFPVYLLIMYFVHARKEFECEWRCSQLC